MTDQYYIHYDNGQYCGKGLNCYNSDTYKSIPVDTEFYETFNPNMWLLKDDEIVPNPNYEQEQAEKRRVQFHLDFFSTSLGYIIRKVSMKTGETKDFLTDLLPVISMAVNSGQQVSIITYEEPDFTQEVINWEELQTVKVATPQFIQECFAQVSTDFTGV